MELLKQRIRQDGKVKGTDVLKVDDALAAVDNFVAEKI